MYFLGISSIVKLIQVDGKLLGFLAGGAVAVGLLLLLYRGVLLLRDKAKSVPFAKLVKSAAGRQPSSISDPAKRARLDDLRKNFEEGVEKFRAAGKDLYALPWYLLVGPSGSGKTEAMRHCKVGFPPGLQDFYQGTGGTVNMHWWFTNYAVVLDTAGRIFMEEASLQGGSEWREFLKLLKQFRANAPINGMLLVISADSLIKDSDGQIETKAGHIARQLDTIQRNLDVRFPVYIILTKCDLIPGFREFFDKIEDPQLQHQILGWSNPAQLDEAFSADSVDGHIETVRKRLLRRRATLLLDPVHSEGPQARRVDQVDELFTLPDNLAKITPKLRRYLEIIFQVGEWSPKPLFLRGIYFTSSMREGEALDKDLATALGVAVDRLPGGKVWDRERSYFLRDLFISKVFREKGLVTRATNVGREQSRRRRIVLGTGIAAAAALLGLTLWSNAKLRASVKDPTEFWSVVAKASGDGGSLTDLELFGQDEREKAVYLGKEEVRTPEGKMTRLEALKKAREFRERGIPVGFFGGANLIKDVNETQEKAYAAYVRGVVSAPLLRETRAAVAAGNRSGPDAAGAVSWLVRSEVQARGLTAADETKGSPKRLDIAALAKALAPVESVDIEQITRSADVLSPQELVAAPAAGTSETLGRTDAAIRSLKTFWAGSVAREQGKPSPIGKAMELSAGLAEFQKQAREVGREFGAGGPLAEKLPATSAEYSAAAGKFAGEVSALEKLAESRKLSELAKGTATDAAALEGEMLRGLEAMKKVEEALSAEGDRGEAQHIQTLRTGLAAAMKDAETSIRADLAKIVEGLNAEWGQGLRGPAGDQRGLDAVLAAYRIAAGAMTPADDTVKFAELQAKVGEIDQQIGKAQVEIAAKLGALPENVAKEIRPGLERALEIARAGRVGGASVAAVRSAVGAGGVAGMVEELARKEKDAGELTGLRLSKRPVKAAAELKYHPAAAAMVLKSWTELSKAVGDSAGRKPVVEEEAIRAAVANANQRMAEYTAEIAAYWKGRIDDSFAVSAESWRVFADELKKPGFRAEQTSEDLGALLEWAGHGLKAVGEQAGAAGVKAQGEEYLKWGAWYKGREGTGRAKVAYNVLSEIVLMPDEAAARAKLFGFGASDGRPLMDLGVATAGDPPREYWAELVGVGLQRLGEAYEKKVNDAASGVWSGIGFPLVNDRSRVMSVEQVAAASAAITAALASAGAEGGTPGWITSVGADNRFAKARDLLTTVPAALAGDKRKKLAAIEAVAKVLSANAERDVELRTLLKAEKPAGEDVPAAREVLGDSWTVSIGGKVVKGPGAKFDTSGELIGTMKVGAGGLKIEVADSERRGAVGVWEDAGPWTVVNMYLGRGAIVEGNDVLVPIFVEGERKGGSKGPSFIWVRAGGLPAGLPRPTEWPGAEGKDGK